MFIINMDKIGFNYNNFFICDEDMSKSLIKNGFPLLSAIYRENKFIFVKTDKLNKFLKRIGGDEKCQF